MNIDKALAELNTLKAKVAEQDKVSDKIYMSMYKMRKLIEEKNKIYSELIEKHRPLENKIEDLTRKIGQYLKKNGKSIETISKTLDMTAGSMRRFITYGGGNILRTTRVAAYKKDNKMCRVCNANGCRLELHHIYTSTDHSLENLVLLCKKCHVNAHKAKNATGKEYKKFVKENF